MTGSTIRFGADKIDDGFIPIITVVMSDGEEFNFQADFCIPTHPITKEFLYALACAFKGMDIEGMVDEEARTYDA